MKIKKLKKVMAGILSAAMVMSTMAVTAFAAGPDTILQQTGSLTINKYEGDDTSNPLEGVEFTMYKIADITQTVSNGVVDTKATPVSAIAEKLTAEELTNIANGSTSSAEWTALLKEISLTDLTEYDHQTTGKNGKVVFSNVPIGIYAVAETDAPSQVVSKSANFIVSIPMTTDDGDSWNYDIVANPKNETAYGGISLLKKGKTGNVAESALEGVKFVLQQQADGAWKTIQENLTTSASGLITVEDLSPATYRFVEVGLGEDNNGYILDGKATYEFEIRLVDGKSHIFYDENGDGTKEDQDADGKLGYTINALNEKPTLEKTVKDGDDWENQTDASIGDTVTWKVTASVPSKVNELKVYSLKDTMSSALTWVSKEAAHLTITTTPEVTLTENTDYTLSVPRDNTAGGFWTITFTDDGKAKLAQSDVTSIDVTFNTVLNTNAAVGSAGNLNTGELDYSNAIYPTEDPSNPNNDKEPSQDVITDQAIVYTFALGVEKVDGSTNTPLANVTFDLYAYNGTEENVTEDTLKSSGTKVKVTATADGAGHYVVDAAGNATLTTDSAGNIGVNGLENGNYYLVETKTNDGYNLLSKPVKVEINVVYTTTTTTVTNTNEDGITTITTTVKTDTFTGGENNTGTYKIQVQNNKGFQLPTTGGAGTLLASLIGILLMGGGAFVFISSRKKKKAE